MRAVPQDAARHDSGSEYFPDWLTYRASASPARTALVAGGELWSYAELDADATALAHQLAARGVRSGDRVASLLHNGAVPVVLVHATLRLGAALVPLNLRLRDAELAWQLADSGASLLIIEERTTSLADAARRGLPEVITATAGGNAPGRISLVREASESARRQDPDATLLNDATPIKVPLRLTHAASAVIAIIYTSGTTGQPKGALLTVGNFWWSAIGSALNLGAPAGERWLAVLPLFHVGGLSIVLRSAIHGTTVIVHEGFDAAAVNRAIDEDVVTIVSVVGVMLHRMLDARDGRRYPLSLRCILLGGGPAPVALLERCATIGVPVVQTYGLTETCSQVATLAPEDALRKQGSAGRSLYPNALRIAGPDGRDAAAGELGEILVRGPIVMAGYAGRPDATAAAIVDGWLHTGDIGSLDADGFLYVHDRRDDLIVTGGENVYPAEVEAALLAYPGVAEAAVVGVPDETWGQRVRAIVRVSGTGEATGADLPELLRAHCRSRLAGYKVPSEVRVTSEALPRTASGKLKRSALREDARINPSGPALPPG